MIVLLCIAILVSCSKPQKAEQLHDEAEAITEISVIETAVDVEKKSEDEIQAFSEIALEELVGKWIQITFNNRIVPDGNYFEVTKEGEEYHAVLQYKESTISGIIQQKENSLYFIQNNIGVEYIIYTTNRPITNDFLYRSISFADKNGFDSFDMSSFQREDIIKKRYEEDIVKMQVFNEVSDKTFGIVNDNNLRIRSEPNTTSEIIGVLNTGDKVKIIRKASNILQAPWYEIRTVNLNTEGYVFGEYLDIYEEEADYDLSWYEGTWFSLSREYDSLDKNGYLKIKRVGEEYQVEQKYQGEIQKGILYQDEEVQSSFNKPSVFLKIGEFTYNVSQVNNKYYAYNKPSYIAVYDIDGTDTQKGLIVKQGYSRPALSEEYMEALRKAAYPLSWYEGTWFSLSWEYDSLDKDGYLKIKRVGEEYQVEQKYRGEIFKGILYKNEEAHPPYNQPGVFFRTDRIIYIVSVETDKYYIYDKSLRLGDFHENIAGYQRESIVNEVEQNGWWDKEIE
jgi:uncharacterized protein YgiM (DUF1202 family)